MRKPCGDCEAPERPVYRLTLCSAFVVREFPGLIFGRYGEGECGQVTLHEPG